MTKASVSDQVLRNIQNQQMCTKCILVDLVPGISFDKHGVCNFCTDYQAKENRDLENENYEQLERQLIKQARSNSRRHPYDVLCLYSGGKDSTYMLHLLANKFKLRVLAYTFDNYFIAPETVTNINQVMKKLNVDHVFYKPSWKINKSIFKTGMVHADKTDKTKELAFMVGHACWPCFTQISMHSIKFALDKNIPSIVIGTTPGQIRQKKYNQTAKYSGLVDVYKTMVQPMLGLLNKTGQRDIAKQLDLSFFKQLKVLRMKLIPFYEYVHYNEAIVLDTIQRELDWKRPASTDSCSTNCHLNSLGIQVHKNKYGLSPYVIPLARDVRQGLVERDAALKAVESELNNSLVSNMAKQLEVEI